MTTAVYVRISEDREGAGLGVDRQAQDCRALAAQLQLGGDVEVLADNDISAYSGRCRPSYDRLLDGMRSGRYAVVLAWHTDRLHRTPRDLEEFIDVVDAAGVRVETVKSGPVDLRTPSGRAVARTLTAWARYDSEHTAERIRRKVREIAENGGWSGGGRPFGFEPDGVTVREDEAEEVRRASALVLSGASLGDIVRDLNGRRVLTATGKPWGRTQLRQVLTRARNAGLRQYQGDVLGEAAWLAIVEESTWRAVCALLLDPSRTPAAANARRWLLSGLAVCGMCGEPMRTGTVQSCASGSRSSRTVYRCSSGSHVARHADPVDDLVRRVVIARLSQPAARHRRPGLCQAPRRGAGATGEAG
ncbi:MAG TPA: recombinase family protein [Dermatophilaceae bacterium]